MPTENLTSPAIEKLEKLNETLQLLTNLTLSLQAQNKETSGEAVQRSWVPVENTVLRLSVPFGNDRDKVKAQKGRNLRNHLKIRKFTCNRTSSITCS